MDDVMTRIRAIIGGIGTLIVLSWSICTDKAHADEVGKIDEENHIWREVMGSNEWCMYFPANPYSPHLVMRTEKFWCVHKTEWSCARHLPKMSKGVQCMRNPWNRTDQ